MEGADIALPGMDPDHALPGMDPDHALPGMDSDHALPGLGVVISGAAWPAAGDTVHITARNDDDVVGGVLVTGPELRHLRVREDARGHGLGSALIRAAERVLAEQGHREATLMVGVHNDRARALYLRHGYRPTGRTDTSTEIHVASGGRNHKITRTEEQLRKLLPG